MYQQWTAAALPHITVKANILNKYMNNETYIQHLLKKQMHNKYKSVWNKNDYKVNINKCDDGICLIVVLI